MASLDTLLGASVAPSTKKKYDGLWGRWTNYATIHNMAIRPALGKDVALFLAHLSQSKTKTVCISAAAAISWNHTSRGLVSPCNEVIVKSALAGARRLFAAPIQRKEPFSLPLLRRLVNSLSPWSSLEDAQLTFYVVIAFFGLFRYSDMKQLRVKDFANNGQNLLVTLPCSKTDKFRAGANVYLSANTDEPLLCPVATSNRYFVKLAAAGCDKASLVLMSLSKPGKLTSASSLTRRLRTALQPLVADTNDFTLHSFRSGGATAAAKANVPRSLIATHGRWQSDCVNNYIKLDDATRYSVSRAISKVL